MMKGMDSMMPVRFPGRRFQVWEHTATRHRLLLRSSRYDPDAGERRVDVLFTGVTRVNLPTGFNGLEVAAGSPDDLPAGVHVTDGEQVYLVRGRGFSGYVIAAALAWAEDDEDYGAPSSLISEPFPPSVFDMQYGGLPFQRYKPDGGAVPPPLSFAGRSFGLLEYSVSHGQLLLRSEPSAGHDRRCDLYFKMVARLDLPTRLEDIEVRIAAPAEVPAAARELGAEEAFGDPTYLVRARDGSGFVVAGVLYHVEYEPAVLPAAAA